MRQKYLIIQDAANNKLKIREYAIIKEGLKNVKISDLRHEDFSFVYQGIYDSEIIVSSISKGINDLVRTLRTPQWFPIENNTVEIAKSVITLYNSIDDSTRELFFDDVDRNENKDDS